MVGTKWYKCDLHLHTPASKCFEDKSITPEQWVQAAIEKGLDCVAITDHNSADWVDKIQGFAKDKGLWVFPGVELTCSDAKVHLLVLFDIGVNKTAIEDFMLRCGINRADFGKTEAHSGLSVEDVLVEVNRINAICIPAHIDEMSGISEVANTLREKLFQSDYFLGVQVVNKELVRDKDYNKAEALVSVNRKWGVSETDIENGLYKISESQLRDWRSPIQQAKKNNKAILTFSDNPHSQELSNKHGIDGIGTIYSWIKMDQKPSLESLRQAMLLHQFRIKTIFESEDQPYTTPDTWIKSITIKETEISKKGGSVIVKFNPQMNTIIGGRGSGKSSILQFLRGVFQKENELASLSTIQADFNNFFRIKDKRKQGVLKAASEIEVVICRREEQYKIIFTQTTPTKSDRKIYKYNDDTKEYDLEQDLSFLKILDFEIYSQKQIYEIANNPNSLREKIDNSSQEIKNQKELLRNKRAEYIKESAAINELKIKVERKEILKSEILDLRNKIDIVKETGIENELKKIQEYNSDDLRFKNITERVRLEENQFSKLIQTIRDLKLVQVQFTESNLKSLESPIANINSVIENIAILVEKAKSEFIKLPDTISTELKSSQWLIDKTETERLFREKRDNLLARGIAKIDELEADIKKLSNKNEELKELERIENEITKKESELSILKSEFIQLRANLSNVRKYFLESLLTDGKVKATILSCQDFEQLEEEIRDVLSSSDSFEKDINTLIEYWSSPDFVRANKGVFDKIYGIFKGTNTGVDFDKRFITKIKSLNGEQLNSFDLMFPEDVIKLEYKNNAGDWKALSNASAGQKTAAILTLILSEGNKPLILDQPEDDLDNYLIYDLVVDQLRKSKETRQIIAVTHNANIPVNGDSEVIIVMDSETKHLSPKHIGTIEENDIKRAVCSIMEGGTDAFEMRSKRYQNIKS